MTGGTLSTPRLITSRLDLGLVANSLRQEAIVAVDTESNSLYAYREQVCLIQFSTTKSDYLVDPLALRDLSKLGPLFSDAKIEKVFHAAEYDLTCLRRDYGFEFANLFDTMHAARILGRPAVGLGTMLEEEFGVRVDKRQQRANWGRRPLTSLLMDYARQDTHYLIALRDILRDELRQRELLDLANEDFRRMATANASSENREPGDGDYTAGCWRVRGSHDLHPQQAAVLRELCSYRERAARAMNRPLFKVIHDQTLLQIAALTPRSPEELLQTPGMSPKQMQRHGSHLLQAVQRGLKAAPIHPPRHMRLDAKLAERLEALRAWRKNTGLVLHMPSDVVLPRDLLFHVAEKDPQGPEELREAMAEVPWRFEHFGAAILQILAMVKTK